MSGHPGVSITLFRIQLMKEEGQNEDRKLLDDIVVTEFMTKNICTSSLVCRELEANDPSELVDAFRSLENIYDLVIAGKKQELGSQFEIEMKPWVEYEELGIIGDLFASSDCGGIISVLVIQCFGRVEGDVLGHAHEINGGFSSSSKLCDTEQHDGVVRTDVDEKGNPTICTEG